MTEEELQKLIAKNTEAIKENLLKSEIVENIKKKILEFLEANLKKDSILHLRLEKLKTNIRIRTLWSTTDGYPASNPQSYLEPWIDIFNQFLDSKTIKERWEDEKYFVETRKQGETSDTHIIVGKKDSAEKSHSIVDAKTGEIRIEDNQIDSSEVVPVLETYLTFPDGRTIVSRRGKLEEINKPPKESGPILDIEGSFAVSGGPDGQSIGFQAKNIGDSPAMDIVCWFVADEGNIAKIEGISHRLSPNETSLINNFIYSHTIIPDRIFPGLKIIFEYKDLKGNTFKTGRLIKQDLRADGKFNLHSRPGEFVIIQ